MASNINILLTKYLTSIANAEKTISERVKEQDRPTVPAEVSEDEKKFYEDLLKILKPKKKK